MKPESAFQPLKKQEAVAIKKKKKKNMELLYQIYNLNQEKTGL